MAQDPPLRLDELDKSRFDAHLGESFLLSAGEGATLELRLVEVQSLAPDRAMPQAHRAPFSLIFHGPMTPWARQHAYPLEHPAFGRIEIFLVPIGPDAEGMRYEAVFN